MKICALVIDDKYEERQKGYERLREASEKFGGYSLVFDPVKHPNELPLMLRTKKYHAVLLDAVLNEQEGWTTYSIGQALREIGTNIPIALLSGQWDETNSLQINEAWTAPNCRTFLHWRDINPVGNGQIDFAVRPFLRMINDSEAIDGDVQLGESSSIWILHISDIQIGGFDDRNVQLEAKRNADLILERTSNVHPTFVALTGDVAEHGTLTQYARAKDWLSYFLARLGCGPLPFDRLLHVAGNHDVNLALAASSRLKPKMSSKKLSIALSKTLVQPDLMQFAYHPFRQFEQEVSRRPFLASDAASCDLSWVDTRFRHLGVVFYGVNTAQPANAFGLPGREVSAKSLANISVELKKLASDEGLPPVVIGLAHHAPVPVAVDADGAVTNAPAFETFFRSNPSTALFLHGHTHQHDLCYTNSGSHRLVRSAAMTLTKSEPARPRDTLRGFNLLELKRSQGSVVGLVGESYGWVSSELVRVKRSQWHRHTDALFKEDVSTG